MRKESAPLMVSVYCITYNQEPYIRDCIEGIVAQKTSFRFEAIVHDDASTDGTAAIIQEYAEKYPDIIKPIYEIENQYSKHDGSLEKIMDDNMRGKYIAFCEGDDYWIDPLKLQKQVDFMESNMDYSLVHTRFKYLYENENRFVPDEYDHNNIMTIIQGRGNIGYGILDKNRYRIQTMTALIRSSCYNKIKLYKVVEKDLFLMGDTQLWMNLLNVGKFKYFPIVTSVYRVNQGSVSKPQTKEEKLRFALSCEEMRCFYAKKYNLDFGFFYNRYAKLLLKYKIINPAYVTDSRIISEKEHGLLVKILLKCGVFSVLNCLLKSYYIRN